MSASYKIVFLGEPGAGKTTCIGALSDIPPVCTDVPSTEALAGGKAFTTVALDYGELHLDQHGRLLLYGLPGQARFRHMFEVVRDGLVGAILLVDAASDQALAGLELTLSTYALELEAMPLVLVLNKQPSSPRTLHEASLAALRRHRLVAPVMAADVRSRADVVRVFDLLFLLVAQSGYTRPAEGFA